jgi:membrane protease YdiL (CAAX protease family)
MEQLQNGVLFFLLIALLLLYSAARSFGKRFRQEGGRARKTQGLSSLAWQLLLVACLTAQYQEGSWTLVSVGLESGGAWLPASILGAMLYMPLAVLAVVLYKSAGYGEALRLLTRQDTRRTWPSRRIQKVFFLIALLLNPFTEELVFRGVLVHQLGMVTGSVPLAAGLGLMLCLVGHLHQGILASPFHAAFFATTVLLLYTRLGLAGAIGLHFVADVAPQTGFLKALWRRDRKTLSRKPRTNALRQVSTKAASQPSGSAEPGLPDKAS